MPEKPAKPVAGAPAPKVEVAAPKYDLPISKTKWERLAELTSDYMNDKITPQDYHRRRAEIIAEP